MHKNKTRRATPDDEPQIQKILDELLQSMPPEQKPQFNWTKETLSQELQVAEVWIIETKSFLCFREGPEAYEITVLATSPRASRQGHQTNLLTEIKQLAEVEKKQIWLEVHAQNTPALNFYNKNGFTISASRKRYYSDGGDALLMSLKSPSEG
jgi:ribosomal protein S18 acetylase RimI-like enzyme